MLFPNIADMCSPPIATQGNTFSFGVFCPSNETAITFANGTTRNILTVATTSSTVIQKFKTTTDGPSLFKAFCSGNILKEYKQSLQTSSVPSSVPISSALLLSSSVSLPASSSAPPQISSQVPYKAVPTGGVKGFSNAYPSPIAVASDGSIA